MGIAVGQVLGGKYRIDASIGRGGMGEVFAASHLGTGARAAVKVVSRAVGGDVLVQRLQREAIAAGRIRSDYVPRVFDVDRTEEGELFIVMELLRGEPLSERLRARRGVLTWDEVRSIGEDVLSGLMDAHAAGVVHRDLKPGNIFVEQIVTGGAVRERGRILDFGVAKLDTPDTEKLTTTGESVGTVTYMAPEQIRGASRVDERADLYAFAMVAFEALAGRIPYDETGQIAILASKLERKARSLGDLARTAVPPGLDALLARGLARKPADRFGSAGEMMRAWHALGPASVEPRAGVVPEASLQGTATTGAVDRPAGSTTRLGVSIRAPRVAMAIAALVLIGASVVLTLALRPSSSRAAGPEVPAAPVDPASTATPSSAPAEVPVVTDVLVPRSAPDPPWASAPIPARAARPHPRHSPRPAAPSSQGPHISTEPRY